jgi:nitroreductase
MSAEPSLARQVFDLIKSRRAIRDFSQEPVSDQHLTILTEAARWATSASNRRLHKFLVVRDPATIRHVRAVSPGMRSLPPAMIVILTDLAVAERESLQLANDHANWMDVGTAAMTMMLMAHALGLGSCPVTSFSQSGVAVMLDLPAHLIPEWITIVGHPLSQNERPLAGKAKSLRACDLTYWDRVGQHDP